MPAAVAIPLIAGAGASVAGSAIQAHSAKNAAKTQAQSADKALAFNQRVYDDQMRMVNPYVQFGTQSLGNLGRMAATPFSEQTNGYVQAAQGGGIPSFQQGMSNPAQGLSLGSMGAPQGGPMAPQGGGQMVRLRAPNGEMAQFPMGHPNIQRALAAGAQRVM